MHASREDAFVISCPKCGKKYRIAQHNLGKLVRCTKCRNVWRALSAGDKTASIMDMTELTSTDATMNLSQGNNSSMPLAGTQTNPPTFTNPSLNDSSMEDESAWIGRRLGRFEIVDVLGKGAMGVVFRAHDRDLKRDVALKILAKQFIRNQKKTYRLEQFIREARSAAQLTHPHTVIVYEIGQDQGWYFIAMELVEGKTLFDLVKKKKRRIPMEQACELIAQAAEALSAAHRLGIVHRDIKPTNIMLTKEGRVKVADFGLAQLSDAEDDFELPTKTVGTPYWMSPEQCQGETAVPQSDIYALGALLFFALTGEVPYRGKTKQEIFSQHLGIPVLDPRTYRNEIPEVLVRIINRAMAKRPGERYQDAAEMAIGLRQAAHVIVQAKMTERWGGPSAGGLLKSSSAYTVGPSSLLRGLFLVLIPLLVILGGIYWYTREASELNESAPPPVVVPSTSEVPVYSIEGSVLFHAEGCPRLEVSPPDDLKEFSSDREAITAGLTSCMHCEELLAEQKKQAQEQPTTIPVEE